MDRDLWSRHQVPSCPQADRYQVIAAAMAGRKLTRRQLIEVLIPGRLRTLLGHRSHQPDPSLISLR